MTDELQTLLGAEASEESWRRVAELCVTETANIDALVQQVREWASDRVELAAPADWVSRMAEGDYKPADALVQAIDLSQSGLTSTKIVKLLRDPHLVSLERLDVGKIKVANTFWKALRTQESTRHLRSLRCGYIIDKNSAQFDGEHHLDALTSLTLRHSMVTKPQHVEKLYRAPMLSRIEHLTLELTDPSIAIWARESLDSAAALPSLSQLTLAAQNGRQLQVFFEHDVMRRVDTVSLVMTIMYSDLSEQLRLMTESAPDGPSHLNLEQITIDPGNYADEYDHARLSEIMADALRIWETPSKLERITLGQWDSPTARENLKVKGIEVADA